MNLRLIAMFVVTALIGCATVAQDKSSAESYTWYEGGKPKRVWLDKSLVAEFGNRTETGSTPAVKANGVRIWRQDDAAAARAARQGKVSPVLRDTRGGPMRALPGNVIVQLNPNWDNREVSAWLSANGLTEVSRLPIGKNAIVVSSPPGLASLELANRLQESGSVVSAQPNWWEEKTHR